MRCQNFAISLLTWKQFTGYFAFILEIPFPQIEWKTDDVKIERKPTTTE